MAPSSDKCTSFWSQVAPLPEYAAHPVASQPAQWGLHVPLGMHGDAAPFTKLDSLWCLSWSSLLSPSGSPFDNRWLICALPTPWMENYAKKWVAHVVAWSLACISDCHWPHTDHLGEPWPPGSVRASRGGTELANGVRGCLVDCRGDWPHQSAFFDVPYHNCVPEMCWLCHATHEHGPMPFSDVSSSAAWRASMKTTAEYDQTH